MNYKWLSAFPWTPRVISDTKEEEKKKKRIYQFEILK